LRKHQPLSVFCKPNCSVVRGKKVTKSGRKKQRKVICHENRSIDRSLKTWMRRSQEIKVVQRTPAIGKIFVKMAWITHWIDPSSG
jgi:hypothetical protein